MHDFSPFLLFLAALGAGIINSVAGGGGLIAFPALLIVGVPPIYANATNKTALWFGTFASTIAYRQELSNPRSELFLLTITSVVGGIFGSYLLLYTPPQIFARLIPFLMLGATGIFALRKLRLKIGVKRSFKTNSRLRILIVVLLQLIVASYGGFFGGGAGILMLAVLNMTGIQNIHIMSAYKCWLATCINGVAIINLALSDAIVWDRVIIMGVGALIGGYGSAYIARKLNPILIGYAIAGVGFSLSIYFFIK
ncbi:sulfite exporter TauE/SafE family protein [Mastigocoleus testarum]|uniref:Probable membrane transporter protein n=1 Tax=Mastigocoleus testarum BC008 TaxID=371196 RepID=A0A0V7ZW77_9CYAN|nr:sulfite exporter TauE/SafE family protein [Mastigocoleus testarum]KST68146.1 hypothetical protein BC008_32515 [Mastigocoleus testarum BC008]KST68809.1 hypothetical protein BC008_34200 [Mastigocoleus testarum BC008]